MSPLDFVGVPDWRSAVLAILFTAPWLVLLVGKRLGRWETWAMIAASMVAFPLSIAWVQVPIQRGISALYAQALPPDAIRRYLLFLSILPVFVSGLVQECVKFGIGVAGLHLTGERRVPRAGLALGAAVGVAYGGIEAFWVFNAIFGVGFTWATVQLGGIAALLGFIERFFSVIFHTAVAALSVYGYARGRPWRFLLLAICIHSLSNYSVALLQANVLSMAGAEIAIALIAIASLAIVVWLGVRTRRVSTMPEPKS
jgi:hypothetical protein